MFNLFVVLTPDRLVSLLHSFCLAFPCLNQIDRFTIYDGDQNAVRNKRLKKNRLKECLKVKNKKNKNVRSWSCVREREWYWVFFFVCYFFELLNPLSVFTLTFSVSLPPFPVLYFTYVIYGVLLLLLACLKT